MVTSLDVGAAALETARLALRRTALWWWWLLSWVVMTAWSERRGFLMLVVLRQWRLPDRVMEAWFVDDRMIVVPWHGGA
jgi:hypothetical protein